MPRMLITGYVDVPDDMPDPYAYASAHKNELEVMDINPANEPEPKNDNRERHPSYGVIEISRGVNGGGRSLFGSSILHSNTISIRIREASLERSLCYDSIYGEGTLIEIELSQSQFADMITSMNMGGGTPCTFRWIRNKGNVADCPFKNKRKQFENELSENVDKANLIVEQLAQKISMLFESKKALTKADKQAINSLLNQLINTTGSDRKFIYASFNEQMDATVKEAKGEIEAFMQNKILRTAGIELENRGESLVEIETDDKNKGDDKNAGDPKED